MDPAEIAQAQHEQMLAEQQAYAEAYGQEIPEGQGDMEDPDYYEYDVDQMAAQQYN